MVGPTDTSHFSFSYSNFSWLQLYFSFSYSQLKQH